MSDLTATSLHGRPLVTGFYEQRTGSVQYVVADAETKHCAIVDPVHDFDPKSGATATRSADALLAHIARAGYRLQWILDTHPHADHFSAAGYLHDRTGAPTAIGEKVVEVQKLWKGLYNLPETFPADGSQWDRLFADGERFRIGNLDVEVLFTPGHTLASVAYRVGDAAFIHDTLFMPDSGSARADFPGGSARTLWPYYSSRVHGGISTERFFLLMRRQKGLLRRAYVLGSATAWWRQRRSVCPGPLSGARRATRSCCRTDCSGSSACASGGSPA
jgi:glyoxylase-like metal-dependent hydrolase (beta-lactamase superfamily II)